MEVLSQVTLLEWIGYLASIIIAISMTMSSIVKFRLINLVGASLFSTYGFVIGAYPVGFLNLFIVSVDIYYLIGIFARKEVFEILEVRVDNKYLMRFLDYHIKDIQGFFPGFTYKPELNTYSFFVLRNMSVAGLFLAHRDETGALYVGLDFVIPEYRDFKNGKYVYSHLMDRFVNHGFTKIVSRACSNKHAAYLMKLGFKQNSQGLFEKQLV